MRRQELLPATRPKDARAVVYVAGHGMGFDLGDNIVEDYLIFRPEPEFGRTVDKTFEAGSLDTNIVRRSFHNLSDFDIFFLFDVCRSLKKLNLTADGRLRGQPGRTFTRMAFDAGTSQMVTAFTTSENQVATDRSTIERQGLYVAKWRELLAVKGLAPAETMEITRYFVSRDGQTPSEVKAAAHKYRLPWDIPQNDCQRMEKNIWNQTVVCGASLLHQDCQEALCAEYSHPVYHEARRTCALPSLKTLFGVEMSMFCQRQPLAASVEKPPAIDPSTPTGTRAVILALSERSAEPTGIEMPSSLPYSPTLLKDIAELPIGAFDQTTLAVMRTQVLAADIVPGVGAPLAAERSLPLYSLPSKNSPLIFSNIPEDTTARLDCTNQACGGGWVGVTTKIAGEYWRGFVPYHTVDLTAGGQTIVIDFDPDASTLAYDQLSRLIMATEKAIDQKASVGVSIFESARQDAGSAILQHSREMSLRRLVLSVERDGQRLSPERLTIKRIERPSFISAYRAIVEFKPVAARN